jgi:hypothetical protein
VAAEDTGGQAVVTVHASGQRAVSTRGWVEGCVCGSEHRGKHNGLEAAGSFLIPFQLLDVNLRPNFF